jgi:putative sterol carrier protein
MWLKTVSTGWFIVAVVVSVGIRLSFAEGDCLEVGFPPGGGELTLVAVVSVFHARRDQHGRILAAINLKDQISGLLSTAMTTTFPSAEWLTALEQKLNVDERYAQVARNWEGDLYFVIQPEANLKEEVIYYLDLWHGKCRGAEVVTDAAHRAAAFTLRAGYHNFAAILQGKLDPMQAMLTRRLEVKGSMIYMMRNVPTVLDFVRCAREVTDAIL